VTPERIAHGEAASDDPSLVAELTARGIPLDLCPTSNVQAGIVPSLAEHALVGLHRAGAPVTLNTDDTTVSDVTLTEEYGRAVRDIGLTLPELWAIDRLALEVAFADPATLAPLRAEFDAWAAAIPELSTEPAG
jgi:adenosine deaminase